MYVWICNIEIVYYVNILLYNTHFAYVYVLF